MLESASVAAFRQAPLAMALVEPCAPFRALAVNAAFLRDVAAGSTPERLQQLGLEDVLVGDERAPALGMLARVAADGAPRTVLEYRSVERRYWEVRASYVDYEATPAILYVGSDVTPREEQRRRLQDASDRLEANTLAGAVAVATDITAHRRGEEALRVLAETSSALAGSLDYRGTLPIVAEILVPRIADVCAIDVVEDGRAVRIAVAGGERVAPDHLRALRGAPLPGAAAPGAAGAVLVNGVDEQVLGGLAADAEQLECLRALALRSSLVVPMAARGGHYGILWLATTRPFRRFDAAARELAEDVARRIATAIDNARLFYAAQDADRRKDEFLAMLSHELRTPLAPIMAWMQILKRAGDPERVRAAIEVVERNVRLQTALIDDLLDLTAITRGKVAFEMTPQDLRRVVETAVETVRAKVAEKGIVLACELPDAAVVVEGDANRLQQVVWNLLTNAIKFSGESGPVEVSLAIEGDAAILRVCDRGAGIAGEFLPHVFDMFRQQERGSRRSYGGLGIGLAIAKRVTELHRGTIEVRSDGVGRGAEFRVRLPLAVAVPTHAENAAGASSSIAVRAILLVEDVPDTREAARVMLEEMGARVIDAAGGAEALAKLDEHPVDLVLCDLRMPLMDGFELIRRIREHPRHRTLPVIAVSGYATDDDEQRTREAGFDGYVRKPFVDSTLAATVGRVLRQRVSVTLAAPVRASTALDAGRGAPGPRGA